MRGDRSGLLWTAASWLSLLAFATVLSLQKIRTFDYWWHLRTGALIAANGSVPKADIYTYTVPGAQWVDIHWLHQLALYGLYTLGGHGAVVVAKALVMFLLLGILGTIGYRRDRPFVTVGSLLLMLLVACDRIMPRPELPTFVFLAGVLALLDRFSRRPDAWVYGVVGIQLLWVNVHGLFALGIALCAIHLAAEIIRPLIVPGEPLRGPRMRRLAALTALASLASLANPNFLDGALYPVQQLGMIGPVDERGTFGSIVAELIPPVGGVTPLPPLQLTFLGLLAGLSFAVMLLNWRRLAGSDPLLWVAFLYLGLGAKRNLALFAIVAAPILARNLNEFLDARPPSRRATAVGAALVSLVGMGLAVDVVRGSFFARLNIYREPGLGVMSAFYPEAAVNWILENRPPGPVCHHMSSGGYMIWALYPDYKVMTDGRLEVFGPEKFIELTVAGPERFRELDREYEFGSVIVPYSAIAANEFLRWLYLNSNWRLVSVDEAAALFVRVPAGEIPADPELDIDAPDLFPPLDDSADAVRVIRVLARANFYSALKRDRRALEIWEEHALHFTNYPQDPVIHAKLLHRAGFGAAAEAILRSLLEERPEDAELHVQVGDLRRETGDDEAARELYDRALAIEPTLPYALYRLGELAEQEGELEDALGLYLRAWGGSHPADPLAILARSRFTALSGGPPALSGGIDPLRR